MNGDLVIDTGTGTPYSSQNEPRNLTLNSPELNHSSAGADVNSHNRQQHQQHHNSNNNNNNNNGNLTGIDLTPQHSAGLLLNHTPHHLHNDAAGRDVGGNAKGDVMQASSPSSLSSGSLERPYPSLTRSTSLVEPSDFLFHRDSRFTDSRFSLFQPGPPHGFLRQHSHPIVEFPTKSGMQRHARDVHMLQEKAHKCEKCFKSFPSSQQLQQHMLVHTNIRKYKCQYCDKAFKQLSHVQQHHRRHTGERPYKCMIDECGKAFAQLSNLQQHQRNHENRKNQAERKPYLCTVCDRRFSTENSLNNHVTKGHISQGPNEFENDGGPLLDGSSNHGNGMPPLLQYPSNDSDDSLDISNDINPGVAMSHASENGGLHLAPHSTQFPMTSAALTNHMAAAGNMMLNGSANQSSLGKLDRNLSANEKLDDKNDASDVSSEFPGLGPAANDIINAASMAVARRMNELSKRDLNLLRFSRAGLYDFPSQVPPMHSSMLVAQQKQ